MCSAGLSEAQLDEPPRVLNLALIYHRAKHQTDLTTTIHVEEDEIDPECFSLAENEVQSARAQKSERLIAADARKSGKITEMNLPRTPKVYLELADMFHQSDFQAATFREKFLEYASDRGVRPCDLPSLS